MKFVNFDVRFADAEIECVIHGFFPWAGGQQFGAFGTVALLAGAVESDFIASGSVVNTMTSSSFSRLADGRTRSCLKVVPL
jgi:hypothetical protein